MDKKTQKKIDAVIKHNGLKTFGADLYTLKLFKFNVDDTVALHSNGLISDILFHRFVMSEERNY